MIYNKTFRTLLMSLGLCLLVSCASTPQTRPQFSANHYLHLASNSTGLEKQVYLLKAANRLIDEHNISQSQSVLAETDNNLPPNLHVIKQLVSAKLLIAYQQNQNALNMLNAMNKDHTAWSTESRIEWHALAAQANENLGNVDASIQQRSDILHLLPKDEQRIRTLAIWQSIENMSDSRIRQLLSEAKTPTVEGWLSLANLVGQSNTPSDVLANQLQQWKSKYPNHPAQILLPSTIRKMTNVASHQPKRIALLLPLQGHYAKSANAIKNGFFAAYYNAKQNGQEAPDIFVVDTTQKNIDAAYQDAVKQGASFVVGPLTKENVIALAKSTRLTVPTLALNSPPDLENRSISNLYQFGLSPIDEARQAAIKAWSNNLHTALFIAPDNAWGKSIMNSFESTWKSLGGQIVGQLKYTDQRNLSHEIRHLLNVDLAYSNEQALKQTLHEKVRFLPRRRSDVDVIFMVASPYMARQIKPMLSYYYAGNIPVYTLSNVYTGQPNASRDHDLNGVHFPDMPWVLSARLKPESLNTVRKNVHQVWPQSASTQAKLYALGIDAYDIIPKLNRMAMLPDLGTPAATGTLYLTSNHHIYRKLKWSTVRGGIPHHMQ